MSAKSGDQDRGYFVPVMNFHLALVIPIGLALLVFYNWKVGLAVFMYGCCAFIVLEALSAPPENSVKAFSYWSRRQSSRKPVLLCIGDSLTHGHGSADFTGQIPLQLASTLGMPSPTPAVFTDPLWVVNAGQNGIRTHTFLHQRMNKALSCHPDFILILLGSNDVRLIYGDPPGRLARSLAQMEQEPTLENLERNLAGMLDFLYQASPLSQVGLCTLPPMGENLNHAANVVVRQANQVIERVVANASGKVSLVPVYAQLETILEKKKRRWSLPMDFWFPLALVMCPLYRLLPFLVNWNRLGALVGNTVLSDGLHLNEHGRDQVVELIVDWLIQANVAKAIAVKS